MTHAAAPPAPMISWRWIATFWFAAAVFEATQSVFIQHTLGRYGGEVLLFLTELAAWLPWALATPFVIDLARRHPVIPAPTARGVAAHLLALFAITMIAEGWSAALQMLFNPWAHRQAPTFWDTLSATLIFHGLICVFAYALILAVTYLVDSRDKVARKVTETAQLNEELSKAQLAALLRQMEPHFMFNTLNSIAGLVRDNRKAAAVNMFLDVQMPVCGGFDVLELLGTDLPQTIIFVTAHDEYALRAFDAGALDYLLKPFDDARFMRALARAQEKIAHYASHQQAPRRLVVKAPRRLLFIDVSDIDWVEVASYYACLHIGRQTHVIRRTMAELERDLGDTFIRIHRSTIVNLERVGGLELQSSGEYAVALRTGIRLRLSRRYKQALQSRLDCAAVSRLAW